MLLQLLVCIFYVLAKPNKLSKIFFLLCYFNKTRASVLLLGFRYFELRNIYKRFRKNSNQYTVVNSFIGIGESLVLFMWFVLALLGTIRVFHTVRVRYIPYAYSYMVQPYAYGIAICTI